jgi:hypothetical protein
MLAHSSRITIQHGHERPITGGINKLKCHKLKVFKVIDRRNQ